eukprot:TRINITY_DN78_c0_g1_i1.p1 TRINITY_DN78_c0_g1~~TRINITY_DN78_c0_g1_i1.p1  ORF type:complete len:704 (+),score=113.16 TRINITY_DN78_c0_g1_i1:180-2291(+)
MCIRDSINAEYMGYIYTYIDIQRRMDQNQQKLEQKSEQNIIIEEKISKVNGEIHVKKYQRGKLLGKGGFAKVYEVTNLENKKIVAAKIIPKSSLTKNRARQKLISEIKIHKGLHNSNIVNFEHVFEDHENVYILLELCANQTLNELIKRRKRLTELEVQCYVAQTINALKYLHANKVIHRDLKLGNLFLNDKMELKLGDFGLATKLDFDGEKKHTICGTPNYIAPEILDGKCGHSYEVDIWSLGVIIYTLLIGKPPFETPDVKTTYKKIRMNNYTFPEHVPISDSSRSLITKILVLDSSKRPNLEDIMNHPFINHGGTIPKVLPLSTLACPPSASYIKQFIPQGNMLRVSQQPQRLTETAPNNNNLLPKSLSKDSKNFIQTDKLGNVQRPLQQDPKWGTATSQNWNTNNMNSNANLNSNNMNTNLNTNSNNNNAMIQTNSGQMRPVTQKSEIKPSQSTKNIPQNALFQTQSNLNNVQSLNNFNKNLNKISPVQTNKSDIWVKTWVDYSSKYGLGYLLSNGSSGVFFNDSTKIVLDPSGTYLEYMERRSQDRQDIMNQYLVNEYPKELQKKVTLLQHFRSYLEGEKNPQAQPVDEQAKSQPLVYVKKWMKTKHAIMFRLSNKIVQVNFTDKTEILLSSENKMVTYVNKKGERSHYPLATALESTNTEMAKRLKYTKEILTHMLNNQQQQIRQSNNSEQNPQIQQ